MHQNQTQDTDWMQRALMQARIAQDQGEVPVGAVLVYEDQVIGEGYNQPIGSNDPCAHAEIIALRQGGINLNNYRLLNTTLYVTLEPCAMCVGAMVHARISRLVFGAYDPKSGGVVSQLKLLDEPFFNHRISYHGGVLQSTCGELLTEFFQAKRVEAKASLNLARDL